MEVPSSALISLIQEEIINDEQHPDRINVLGRTSRGALGIIAIFSIISFIILVLLFMAGAFDIGLLPKITEFFVKDAIGWSLIFFVGISALFSSIIMVAIWLVDMKFKDLRYKMAFFMYHSKVSKGDHIPLQYLANVAVCTVTEITKTLDLMIAKGELKGKIDLEEREYIHLGLTRRGMKFLMALPPAKVQGLDDVKTWALKGHVWGDGDIPDGMEAVEELDELEPEELPPAKEVLQKHKDKVPCIHCGRMNIKDHHFCTFCGEVI